MRLISYDIGIKNLAYCLLEWKDQQLTILDWNVLSLLEKEAPTEQCSQMMPAKNKKTPPCKCSRLAKYHKNNQYFCELHAKKSAFTVPTKQHTAPYLKKLKLPELQQLAKSIFLFAGGEPGEKQKKDDIMHKIMTFYEKQCLVPIVQAKKENAGEADLIRIGKRMKTVLKENPLTATITHVIIENQISPIATRMKTLQGMLTQFYIDHIDAIDVEFVASCHKLNQFTPKKQESSYKENKVSGVTLCQQILEKNPGFNEWSRKLDTKKKDDLADCFLQGLWYFKKKNIISYADDLKINIVSLS